MHTLMDHFSKHAPEYTALLGLFAVAVVANMPLPGSKLNLATLYEWLYNSLQAFLAAKNPHPPTVTVTTPVSTLTSTGTGIAATAPDTKVTIDPHQPEGPAKE